MERLCRACKRNPVCPDDGKVTPELEKVLSRLIKPKDYENAFAILTEMVKNHVGLCNGCSINLSIHTHEQATAKLRDLKREQAAIDDLKKLQDDFKKLQDDE